MDTIGQIHGLLARYSPDFSVGVLAGGDVQGRIRAALHATQDSRRQRRPSPLHPVLVVWLVLSLPLHRATSIANVFVVLLSALRSRLRGFPLRPVTDGALAHARRWLGVEPLRRLFLDIAADVRPEPSFHGLRVWAIDGVHATVPDTPANDAAFGRHAAPRGRSAFPQVHLVTLSAVRTREIAGATWRPHNSPEREMARELLGAIGRGDLLTLDRGFYGVPLLLDLSARRIDFLVRVPSCARVTVLRRRGPGDLDVEMHGAPVPRPQRRPGQDPIPHIRARLIVYTLDGKETVRLLTSVDDPRVTATELVVLYHERWEAEIGYDEIKTHLSTVAHGALRTVFRGRSPATVEQEIWATLALYNLVRRLIARAAELHRVDPRRISFTDALVVIRQAAADVDRASVDSLVPLYVRLMTDLGACRLERWRRRRRAVRAVKVKMSNYALKRLGDRCGEVDFLASLRLLEQVA
jgi:Transposase DDE domain/Insertion element 4 transposase N-terminal